jgi:hypothetical protein
VIGFHPFINLFLVHLRFETGPLARDKCLSPVCILSWISQRGSRPPRGYLQPKQMPTGPWNTQSSGSSTSLTLALWQVGHFDSLFFASPQPRLSVKVPQHCWH